MRKIKAFMQYHPDFCIFMGALFCAFVLCIPFIIDRIIRG